MSKITRKEWYRRVNEAWRNDAWPDGIPPLTADEAVRAARRLYRFGMGRTWIGPVRVTSGNRYTWIRHGVLVVNPEHGWHGLVHMLSHYCHDRRHPESHGHGGAHARAELRMIREAIKRGWLAGKLKTPAPVAAVPDPLADRRRKYERIMARERAWQARLKRANTALRKIKRQRAYYERTLAGPA